MRHKIKLFISYDGTDFAGWQRQKGGQTTIQETLEKALSRLFDEEIKVVGSGRTDAGVHAVGQVAHFLTSKNPDRYRLLQAINSLTPSSIAVKEAWAAPEDFHARASATHKVYRYFIHNSPVPTALRARFTTWIRPPLEAEKLNAYARFLVKKQDFKSFQSSGTEVASTVREIYSAEWKWVGPHLLEFTVVGDGFLKQMVRNIVGTQLDLFQNEQPPEEMGRILAATDRREAKTTAPPQGLHLWSVHYPRSLDNKCRKI